MRKEKKRHCESYCVDLASFYKRTLLSDLTLPYNSEIAREFEADLQGSAAVLAVCFILSEFEIIFR